MQTTICFFESERTAKKATLHILEAYFEDFEESGIAPKIIIVSHGSIFEFDFVSSSLKNSSLCEKGAIASEKMLFRWGKFLFAF